MRVRVIVLSVLLAVALAGTCLAGSATIQAFHSWQQQEKQVKVGDVRLIRYWMTIPHVARVCHVPENYLFQSLHLKNEKTTRSKTLAILATEKHESVDEIIHKTQAAVNAYRRSHPAKPHSPSPIVLPHRTVLPSNVREQEQSAAVLFMFSQTGNSPISLWYEERAGGREDW